MRAGDANGSKIPATVITGFLGAGKTSLIRNLLESAGGRRIALIVNEFGDFGVDGKLLESCGDSACGDIVELANGCICCAVAEEFLPAMEKIVESDEPPDHIVIETSGLALPGPLVSAFGWPSIRGRVRMDGVIAVVDSQAIAEGRLAHDERRLAEQRESDETLDHDAPLAELFDDQLGAADMIVLNKADLLDEAQMEKVEAELSSRLRLSRRPTPERGGAVSQANPSDLILSEANRSASTPSASTLPESTLPEASPAESSLRMTRARNAFLPPEILLGIGSDARLVGSRRVEEAEGDDHGHDHDHDHDDFESFVFESGISSRGVEGLEARLKPILERHAILRMKGFAAIRGKPMRLVIQAVGSRVERRFDRDWRDGEERLTRLAVIGGCGLDRERIEAELLEAIS